MTDAPIPPARRSRQQAALLLLAALVLLGAARLRGAEYDEAYSLFLTSGIPRPAWPAHGFHAARIRRIVAGNAGPARIARELRATDVHPPLYFWALAAWRRGFGPGLFTARLLSVLAALIALALVGAIARAAAIPALPAIGFTLGCYGFAYTGAIARDFALAEALMLAGIRLLLAPRRGFAAGLCLGAACFTNYLAAFPAGAAIAALAARGRPRQAALAAGGMLPFLPPGLWFFLAQRDSRAEQFPPFRLLPALALLGRDAAGALFGGLPLYLPAGPARLALAAALGLALAALAGLIVARRRHIRACPLLTAAALAPPAGLIALGVAFDSTPIELRYLCFATPFLALLLAGALASLRPRAGVTVGAAVALVQALALAGLLTQPRTMQPARAAAAAAARLAGRRGEVLIPRGNDGVGVVGPFLLEAPPWLRVRVVAAPPRALRARRLVLALIGADRASRALLPRLRAAYAPPRWRPVGHLLGRGFDALALDRATPPAPGWKPGRRP